MAAYIYRCAQCGETLEHTYPIGTAQRVRVCKTCGGLARQVLGHVNIQPSALDRSTVLRTQLADERQMPSDHAAYRRMRRRGLQPPTVKGSARLENEVGDQIDIKHRDFLAKGGSKGRLMEVYEEGAVSAILGGAA